MTLPRNFVCVCAVALVLLALQGTAFAVQPDEMLANPQLESRARVLSEGLRCPVCQNQSIDDSDADLAHDLRVIVRQRLQSGDTDAQVQQYLVDRYGDYILLEPPFKTSTLILWLGAPLILLATLSVAMVFYRRRQETPEDTQRPLSAEEQKKIAALMGLQDDDRKGTP